MKFRAFAALLGFCILAAASFSADLALAQFSEKWELLKAVEDNDIAEVRNRIFKGANVNGRKDGKPALVIALENRNYDILRLLLENGAYPNNTTLGIEETPLMVAAGSGDETGLQLLLEYGADPNFTDKRGQTALMKAAQARQALAARILLANGADPFATDYSGRSAMEYAREARSRQVMRLLEEAGLD